MTIGQLFRELIKEELGIVNEDCASYADTVAPDFINVEIPEHVIPELKEKLRKRLNEVNSMSDEQIKEELGKHLSKN